jgi:hypothetical protein
MGGAENDAALFETAGFVLSAFNRPDLVGLIDHPSSGSGTMR